MSHVSVVFIVVSTYFKICMDFKLFTTVERFVSVHVFLCVWEGCVYGCVGVGVCVTASEISI